MPGTFKKAFEVIKSSKSNFEVDTGKRKLKFGKSGGFVVNDAGEAKTIEERYGFKSKYRAEYLRSRNGPVEEAVVIPVDDVRVEAGHRYTFGGHRPMPWASYCDMCGKRIDRGETFCILHKEMEIYDESKEVTDLARDNELG